jgi:hypothetical protein
MSRGQIFLFVGALSLVSAAIAYRYMPDPWFVALIVLVIGILVTVVVLAEAFLHQVKLDEAPKWIENATNLGGQKQRVQDHYERLKGTLVYWKNDAAAHHRLHTARVYWSLLSAVLLPVLVRIYDGTAVWSKVFMTVFTTWTGLIVASAYTLKSEQRYQGMRQQESDYYDLARRLLDFTDPSDAKLKAIVDRYINDVEAIRQTARRVETGAPPSALDFLGRSSGIGRSDRSS